MKDLVVSLLAIMALASLYLSYQSVNTLESINERIDRMSVEYQFVVTDTMMTVYDRNRVVGTVKLEGQLDSLIIADNQ